MELWSTLSTIRQILHLAHVSAEITEDVAKQLHEHIDRLERRLFPSGPPQTATQASEEPAQPKKQ